VDLRGGFAEGLGPDTVIAVENVVGSDHADDLRGDAGPNALLGGGGDDVLDGREGDDFLTGGEGVDFGNGGLGTDGCAVELKEACEG
jgi:Ca2+-binding RTX toxin-like protein